MHSNTMSPIEAIALLTRSPPTFSQGNSSYVRRFRHDCSTRFASYGRSSDLRQSSPCSQRQSLNADPAEMTSRLTGHGHSMTGIRSRRRNRRLARTARGKMTLLKTHLKTRKRQKAAFLIYSIGEPSGTRTQDTRIKSPKQRLPPPSLSVRKWLHNGVFASGRFPQHPPMCAIFREIGTPLAHLARRF